MEPIILVEKLTKEFKIRRQQNLIKGLFNPDYKTVTAVKNINFSVERGEAVAFLGPNGAGKTTTTKMLTGLIYPTKGTVKVLGHTPFDREKKFLKRIGLVMGNKAGLNWDLTAKQSFDLLRKIYDIKEQAYQARLEELSTLLDVKDHMDTQLRRLSLGERMKMELIGAILHEPEVLFLDEPTIGLDIITKKNIRLFLRKIQKDMKTTLVLTSHDMDDVEQVCDRVIIINKGSKVYDNSLKTLTDQYRQVRFVRLVFANLPSEEEFSGLGEIVEKSEDGYLFKVSSEQMVALIAKATTTEGLLDLHIESTPLEEIIGELFKHGSEKSSQG
jgi:ABC-2 type transport system ATP-binding protein